MFLYCNWLRFKGGIAMLKDWLIGFAISAVLLLPFIFFMWRRERVLKQKLGTVLVEVGINKERKLYKYRWAILLGGWVLSIGTYYLLGELLHDGPDNFNPLGFGLTMAVIHWSSYPRPMMVSETGFTPALQYKFIAWNAVSRIEWDRDLGQQEWSYKIFLKNSKTPIKASIWRQNQPQADELFKKFLKPEKEPEAVPV
jgi:hypothetical protein